MTLPRNWPSTASTAPDTRPGAAARAAGTAGTEIVPSFPADAAVTVFSKAVMAAQSRPSFVLPSSAPSSVGR
ncbi:hypothetical protein [Streptomyces prunicolor]|uniref:Uncharacterized protein n=1 Tax=Streptomyces prunicolor TaxID=67348 RepID=A0ABU4FBM8_9ACTN|nr:hypothetical protein [Streptomyces prunicolor]MDV7217984.1 hypothetical protein [Streptomyces prunicolor]